MEQLWSLLTQTIVAAVVVHIQNEPLMMSSAAELEFVLLLFSFNVGMIMIMLVLIVGPPITVISLVYKKQQ